MNNEEQLKRATELLEDLADVIEESHQKNGDAYAEILANIRKFLKPEPLVLWVNCYDDLKQYYAYKTEQNANESKGGGARTIKMIEVVE